MYFAVTWFEEGDAILLSDNYEAFEFVYQHAFY